MWSAVPPPPGVVPPSEIAPFTYQQPSYIPVPVRQNFGQLVSPPPPPPLLPPPSYALAPSPLLSHPPVQSAMSPPAVAPPTSSPDSQQQTSNVAWPQPLREWVQRSFIPGNLDPTVSREEMEEKLKDVIKSYRADNGLWSIDWDAMPLPQVLIRREREMNLRQASSTWASSPTGRTSRKRKSGDDMEMDSPVSPRVAHATNLLECSSLGDRVIRDNVPSKTSSKLTKSEKRLRRFDGRYQNRPSPSQTPEPVAGPVVGTCQTLEKKYLRLTAPPVASAVRPEPVLHQAVDMLKQKWRQTGNYSYVCDQLKSVRQDLTVQRIKNDFTVSVYEMHARIALEKGDLGEYNQCQTQLRSLYALGLKGNPVEFKAYRILYFIHTANRIGLNDAIADLTPTDKKALSIKHALQVRSAIASGNYHQLFKLYMDTPHMGAYLMDMFIDRERLAALCILCKSYKQDVKLRFVVEELGFESDNHAIQFIVERNGRDLLEDRPGKGLYLLTAKGATFFEPYKQAAFGRVDIKGQI